jgi:HAD superfamily hydrolase (TIGR01509 family)
MSGMAKTQPGLIFDCDGVLADTITCWDDAFVGAARGLDLELSRDQLAGLRGSALRTAAEHLTRWSRRPAHPAEVAEVLRQELVSAIGRSELTLTDGVRELLEEFRDAAWLGVASNSPRTVLLHILAHLEITEYFTVAISADDVPRPKPAPDPYLAACAALGVDPRVSFAVEDSEIGIRSAIAAGLTVIELTQAPAEPTASTLRVSSLADPRIGQLVLRSATSAAGDTR